MKKKITAIILSLVMIAPACVPAAAEEGGDYIFDEGGFAEEADVDFGNDSDEDFDGGETLDDIDADVPGEPDGSEDPIDPPEGETQDDRAGEMAGGEIENTVKRALSVSKTNISFGTLDSGEGVIPVSFAVKNEGDAPAYIKWIQADVSSVFGINALSDLTAPVAPSDTADFSVYLLNAAIAEGDYTTNITFQDAEDPSALATVTVSVRIEKKKEGSGNTEETGDKKDEKSEEMSDISSSDKKGEEDVDQASEKSSSSSSAKMIPVTDQDSKEERNLNGRYMISAACSPRDGGYVSGTGIFQKGDDTVLTIHLEDGYHFNGWYKNGKRVSEKRSLKVKDIRADEEYVAEMDVSDYEIVVKTENKDYGKVYGGGWYDEGDSAEIEAEPKDGYVFDGWYEKDKLVSRDRIYKVKNIKKDHKFKAVFKRGQHSVTISAYPSEGGKVSGSGKYNDKADVKLTARANNGYVYKGLMLNNQIITTSDIYTVQEVDRDLSFTAYFEKEGKKTYTLTSGVANAGGVITPSGQTKVEEKGKMTFVIAPDNGYDILAVAIDGKQVDVRNSYTFKEVKKDHTISVAFAPKKGSVKQVKMDKIISVEEAKAIAVDTLKKADAGSEGRSSDIITPEMYAKMKSEGTLEEALKIPEQNVVGMDNTESLPKEVDKYSYDSAGGVYQVLDISPELAERMIDSGDDRLLLSTAYDEDYLRILVNNQYLVPGREKETDDIFEDKQTINNMFEFVGGILTKEEKLQLLDGKQMIVSLSIAPYEDIDEETKAAMEKAGVNIDEYFYMVVMKQTGDTPEVVTKLNKPVEVVMKAPASGEDCVVRFHDGEVDVLEDLDSDPDTVTVRTDRFSPYAFATKPVEAAADTKAEVKTEKSETPAAMAAGSALAKDGKDQPGGRNMMIIFAGAFALLAAITGGIIVGSKKKRKRR